MRYGCSHMAHKIVRTKGSWETASEDEDINWYAPEPQATIKSVFRRSLNDGYGGGAEHIWELVEADPKDPSES